jgi:GxxExxY protein
MTQDLNALSDRIIGCAIAVHRELGPGLLESAYEACLAYELLIRYLTFERQKPLPLVYRDQRLDLGFRIDFLVENAIIVEVKARERLEPVHSAQLLSYLRLSGRTLGLLFNFNVKQLADGGIKRVVNGFREEAPTSVV